MTNENAAFIQSQIALLKQTMLTLLAPGEEYALIDFPDHGNVGDSAIWLGEIEVLQATQGKLPRYVCDCGQYDPDALRRAHPDGPILIHGGGNLGDLWLRHQNLRERLIRDFPDRRIIQMPQSIHFKSSERARQFWALARQHGDVHVLARDRRSFEQAAAELGKQCGMSPDSAFGIGPIQAHTPPRAPVFCLIRQDVEQSGFDFSPVLNRPGVMAADWLEEPATYLRFVKVGSALRSVAAGRQGAQRVRLAKYQRLAETRVNRGLRLLEQGHHVLTDRLHAHILSVLLGKPHLVLDNNYGKIHGYMAAWTRDAPTARPVGSVEEALVAFKAWGV